jgi:uncharacterized protein
MNYDARYLAGIRLFNEGDFFEAHEVWEVLWMDCPSVDRRFYQGLIQAAVGLLHFTNGNVRGAVKLYRSSRAYLENYGSPHQGLDVAQFCGQMAACLADLLAQADPDRSVQLDPERLPRITLDPEPDAWPDPAAFADRDE